MKVLGVFAKKPAAGQVKTRLAAETSPEFAARVATAFLHDLIERLSPLAVQRILAFAPDDALTYFTEVTHSQFELVPQGDGDLGQRMARFFTDRLHAGAAATVLVGTDSPTLPLDYIDKAFSALDRHDLVLGPATDGGYYLIGIARRLPPIFDGIAWGTHRVLAETIARLDPGWKLALLPPWYDVDTLADWQMLKGHLAALQRADVDPGLPRTVALALER